MTGHPRLALAFVALLLAARPASAGTEPRATSWRGGSLGVEATTDSMSVESEDALDVGVDEADPLSAPPPAAPRKAPLESLVPALAGNPYRLSPGPRPYLNRLAFSPGFGALGRERLFVFRLAFHPNHWLGYEATVNHNPAQSVHAVHHSLSAVVRHPLAGRLQPFLSAGYGMFMVFPGRSLNADPVTKNALSGGGGLEFFVRDDLALRGDLRRTTVFGREKDHEGVVAYDYLEQSVALVFYRTLSP